MEQSFNHDIHLQEMDLLTETEETLFILYGSRSGNAKSVAKLANDYAKYCGLKSVLLDMPELDYNSFNKIKHLIIVVSTHGEGEPPYPAEDFYEWLHSDNAPVMKKNKYAVLGLGDSSYKHFCKTGKDIDQRLEELTAERLFEMTNCDLDFGATAIDWIEKVIHGWNDVLPANPDPERGAFQFVLEGEGSGTEKGYMSRVMNKRILNPGSSHEVLHMTLNLKNSDINYQPGDLVGIYSKNSRWLPDRLLKKLKLDPAQKVEVDGELKLLKMALIEDFELTVVTPKVMRNYAEITNNPNLRNLLNDTRFIQEYVENRDILDFLIDFPESIRADQLIKVLRKLPPRYYSVSSSQRVNPDQVDITLRVIQYEKQERRYHGVCSNMLSGRIEEAEFLPIEVMENPSFHLPEDETTDIIMIAAGTGIAPYRAFLQEREATNSKGRNWLIFGERNESSDYFYKEELLALAQKGILTRLDTVFSRDQEEKRYVNQIILEKGKEILKWLDKGACLYICGNKRTIGASVKSTLIEVFMTLLGLTEAEGLKHYESLKKSKNIREDVY